MIKLKRVSFENIRSFVGKQTIVLDDREKLIQIDGQNRNTGGSSGSGKSTVLIAMDYLFGLNDIPSTILQSWLTKEEISVEADLIIDNIPSYLKRSKKKGLYLKYGEEEYFGSLAEEKLQALISVPKNIFRQMFHKRQGERGFFLNQTPKQMYSFLIDMLDLNSYDAKYQAISEDIKLKTKRIEELNINIENYKQNITNMSDIVKSKIKPSFVDTSTLPILIEKKDCLIQKLKELELNKHNTLQQLSKADVPQFTPYSNIAMLQLEEKLRMLRERYNNTQSSINKFNQSLNFIAHKKTKVKETAQEAVDKGKKLSQIMSSVCYTCNQHYVGTHAQQTKIQLEQDIEDLKQAIRKLKLEIDEEPMLVTQVSVFTSLLRELEAEIDKYKSELHTEKKNAEEHRKKYDELIEKMNISLKNKQLEASSRWDAAIKEIQQQIWPLESEIQQLSTNKKNYEHNMAEYSREISQTKAILDNYVAKYRDESEEMKRLNEQVDIAQEANRLIKSYTIQVFQDTLNLIGDLATDLISSIPNVQNSSIYFEGAKESKNGSVKDEVTAIINLNGNNKIPIKAFSGGEKTAIELAVDLAVVDIIESKTQKGINVLILDEPFDGLDSVCKEQSLEILKQHDTNKKIILVDHSSELKEMVSDVITICKDGEVSYII